MPAEATVLIGHGVRLEPVSPVEVDDVLHGALHGFTAGRGWPHADTGPALAFTRSGGLTWLVVDAADTVVGEVGTKAPPDATGTVEIGYGLAGPSQGQGLGSRAVGTLLVWLDQQPDVARVVARVDPANAPSWRLLERLGFSAGAHPGTGPSDERERFYERPTPG